MLFFLNYIYVYLFIYYVLYSFYFYYLSIMMSFFFINHGCPMAITAMGVAKQFPYEDKSSTIHFH